MARVMGLEFVLVTNIINQERTYVSLSLALHLYLVALIV